MSLTKLLMPRIEKGVRKYVEDTADVMRGEIKSRDGGLARSISTRKVSEKWNFKVGVDAAKLKASSPNGFDYSMAYWKGRKGFSVKNAKALRWVDRNGNVHFAKSVGPAEGDPFIERTLQNLPEFKI